MIVREGQRGEVERFDEAPARFDAYAPKLHLGATPVETTREGFEVYEGTATIGDIVLDYPEHGTIEFRPADEVLAETACASMVGKPITDSHPSKLLTTSTASAHVRGAVIWAKRVDEDGKKPSMRVRVVIYDAGLLDKIRRGKIELSPGYHFKLERTAGVLDGRRYSAIQRAIVYNHLAVVEEARTVAPDGTVARLDEQPKKATTNMEMVEITLPDGSKHMVPAAVAAYLKTLADTASTDAEPPTPPADPEKKPEEPKDPPMEAARSDSRIASLETMIKDLARRMDGLPAQLRAEAVNYAETRRRCEPVLEAASVAHRFDGDAFADKFAVVAAVFGDDDDDVKALAGMAGGKAERTPEAHGRMDGLFKSALKQAATGDQLRSLVAPKTKGATTTERTDAAAGDNGLAHLPGFGK